ncbi:MAG: glycosyltransferase family 2 protein [Planctomycetes bacterium]|nr:glycosyltransferase family 2 protein [Planctomycetota bacterium]
MSAPERTLSIVVLSWNTRDLLRSCLASLERVPRDLDHEVIVVDNASADGSADMVAREFPAARLIRSERNLGYAAGNNAGIRAAAGRHVLLLNSDTEVAPDAPGLLVRHLERDPGCGAVGAQLRNPDGTIQRACMRFPNLAVLVGFDTWFGKRFPFKRALERYFYRDFDHAASRDVDQPPAAALAVPRRVYDAVGLLDEDLFLFFNDVDLCRRIRAADYSIHFLAEARVLHHGGASTRHYREFALEWHRNRARYYRRAYGRLACFLAKVMTAWRALEEWWRMARRMTDPAERRAASAEIRRVLGAVWRDAR